MNGGMWQVTAADLTAQIYHGTELRHFRITTTATPVTVSHDGSTFVAAPCTPVDVEAQSINTIRKNDTDAFGYYEYVS